VALRAEDEEWRAIHDQRMASVFSYEVRQRIVVGLRSRGAGAQSGQENDERGEDEWTEGSTFVFQVHAGHRKG
jgi:uncharacterized lipoprotein YmbA